MREENLNNYYWRAPKSHLSNRRRFYDHNDDDDDTSFDYPEVDPKIFRRRHSSHVDEIDFEQYFGRNSKLNDVTTEASTTTLKSEVRDDVPNVNATVMNKTRVTRQLPSGDYFYKKSKEECHCDNDCGEIKNPRVVALNEIAYVDDPDDGDYRFKCTGAVVNERVVMIGPDCIVESERSLKFYQIKAGVNSWSAESGATLTPLQLVTVPDKKLSLILLETEFPEHKSIQKSKLSQKAGTEDNLDYIMWSWDTSMIMPLQWRNKNTELSMKSVVFTQCEECEEDLCIREELTHVCSEYYYTGGNPVFLDDELAAMQYKQKCINDYTAAKCYVYVKNYNVPEQFFNKP